MNLSIYSIVVRNTLRTIEELEDSDALIGSSVSDTLAFCIVASDYMRARRRRFPLSLSERKDEYIDDNVAVYMGYDYKNRLDDLILSEDNILYSYTTPIFESVDPLWDYGKEYLEND